MEIVPNIKIPKSEVQILEDPFLMLGYGINAYFDILRSLFLGMAFISLAISPLLYGYAQNNVKALQHESKYFFNMWSLGNLGGASVTCANFKIKRNMAEINCPAGIIDFDHIQYGVVTNQVDN